MKYISKTIAGFMTIAMMLIFINMEGWMQMAAKLPFMKIDPWISGGEVTDSIVGDNYKIMIHETVYQGLFTEDRNGYVQLDVNGSYSDTIAIGNVQYKLDADSTQITLQDAGTGNDVPVKKCKSDGKWIIRVNI